jgi:hemerythrin-like domain-containing protein
MGTVRVAPDLTFVSLVHQALRVDGARLLATAAALQPDDRGSRLSNVRAFYGRYRQQLVAHHTNEDRLFYPALAARVGDDKPHLNELIAQHAELDGVLERVDQRLVELADPESAFAAGRTNLTDELSTMVEHLTNHLELEESTAIPLIASELSADEYRVLEGEARKATSRDEASFMIPWLVEHASPAQRKALFHLAPPFRVLNLLSRGRYRRLDAALLPPG